MIDEAHRKAFKIPEANAEFSQREMIRNLGVSLGKANCSIRALTASDPTDDGNSIISSPSSQPENSVVMDATPKSESCLFLPVKCGWITQPRAAAY